MVDYLETLGHKPQKVRGESYWYICPFHGEKTASFKVNRSLNRWFHFALGTGGSIIDFGMRYFSCSLAEFLQMFPKSALVKVPTRPNIKHQTKAPENPIVILRNRPLLNDWLLTYFNARGISSVVAKRYCTQISFSIGEQKYFSAAFANSDGGYELRSEFIKLSSSPKGITHLKNDTDRLCVFEGFMDFLSFVEMNRPILYPPSDFMILN